MKSAKASEYIKTLEWIASRYDLPVALNDETIANLVSEMGSLPSIWGLCGKDISELDFTAVSKEQFIRLAFNEYTRFPINFKFNHERILEESKTPGLGISTLNRKGIDGNGVNVAVIDKPILETHEDFAGRIKKYILICPKNEYNEKMHFHGITCAAFLCGNTCGVANGANLYYYAYPDHFEDDGMYWGYHFKALDMVLEHNQTVGPADMIRIVSISAGFPRNRADLHDKMNEYVSKLKETGCYLIFSNLFGEVFTCASKVSCDDNDNPDTYKLDIWQTNEWDKKKVLIPSGGRTSPCNSGNENYMYNGNQSCYSWAIPYICGVFAMALQTNNNLTFSEFCEIAKRTAATNNAGLSVINPIKIVEETPHTGGKK